MKLSKTYEPQQYEPAIYQLWEQALAFKPASAAKGEPFCIMLPPPNANGNLHAGHALTVALEDVAIRYHRLLGKPTVYLPGADHAGFETWVVFERQLEKEGKSRFDFSREQLYQMVWDFVETNRGNMEVQLRQLGASLDWDNLTFALDKKVTDTAFATFKQMWDDGLIYRGKRLVNYCTTHHTGFADIEVAYEDRTTPLYYMKYGPFTLATTRPETKFGDTGVAVHPDDERYKQYVGKELEIEGVNGLFKIKVVADDLVDPNFGTGVVKVTPAHSFDDWEIGERHKLPAVSVIDQDGKMTSKAGRFAGLTVVEARKAIVQALEEKGLLVKVDSTYKNRVGLCYKCKTVIEPLLMDQWFVNVKPLAKRAITAVQKGDITFYPASKAKVLVNYYKNLKDWNISRQIPWGIPIPAFQSTKDPDHWIFDTRVDQETIEVDGVTFKRDPDTFDTWFSSGQWPYVTTDYLSKGDLAKFYPVSVMETGYDILFAWVSRMIMFGLYRTDSLPFKTVYLHGMVVDQFGQKMSKSKGNVLNPMELVAEYGSDATRMGFLANRTPGVNQPYQPATMVAGRNFANKLWNIARFIEDKIGDNYQDRKPQPESVADHWVIQRLNEACREVGELIESYRFAEAYETTYHAIWDDVADWYVESSKINNNPSMMTWVLETILTLAHPFAPFVTETIWQTLKWEDSVLATSRWPQPANFDARKASQFNAIQNLVSEARFVTAQLAKGRLTLLVKNNKLVKENEALVKHLAQLQAITHVEQGSGLRLATPQHEAWLDIDAKTLAAHRTKLEERLATAREHVARLVVRLGNTSYVNNAPAAVVQQTKDQLAEQKDIAERLERELTIVDA